MDFATLLKARLTLVKAGIKHYAEINHLVPLPVKQAVEHEIAMDEILLDYLLRTGKDVV